MTLPWTRRLVFRLLGMTLVATLLLTALLTGSQLYFDYQQLHLEQQQQIDNLLQSQLPTASIAAFNLDRATASRITEGLIRHPAIYRARISQETGQILASSFKERSNPVVSRQYPLKMSALTEQPLSVGQLQLDLDLQHFEQQFWQRSRLLMLHGLLQNLGLACLLLWLFHRSVTSNLTRLNQAIARLDSREPGPLPDNLLPTAVRHSELGQLQAQLNLLLQALREHSDQRQHAEAELRRLNLQLESVIDQRTGQLNQTLIELTTAQSQLLESEKLAAVGQLIAGIANQLGSPIHQALTMACRLRELLRKQQQQQHRRLDPGVLPGTAPRLEPPPDPAQFMLQAGESSQLLIRQLEQANRLLASFTHIAAPQAEGCQEFQLDQYLRELLFALQHQLQPFPQIRFELQVEPGPSLCSYPGALTQILNCLLHNALTHAFKPNQPGKLQLSARQRAGLVLLEFADNGQGMTPELSERVFEPFFTTGQTQGHLGLGLLIASNLVSQTLHGQIRLITAPEQGCRFQLEFPARLAASST